VTYDPQGGSVSPTSSTHDYATTITSQPTPTRNGYTFGGWYTAADDSGERVTEETIVTRTADHEIYVHWTPGLSPEDIPVESINFTPGDNTLEAGQSGRFTPVVLPANATNRRLLWTSGNTNVATVDITGRVYTNQTGTAIITAQAADGSGVSGSYNLTVTGRTTHIIFNKGAGSGGTDTVTVTLGSPMLPVTPPTKENYTFQGYWRGDTQYYKADGTSARNWDVDTAGAMLTARWRGKLVNIRIVSGQEPDIQLDEPLAYREVYYMEPYGHIFPKNIAPEEYAREHHYWRRYFRWIPTMYWNEIDHVAADTIVTLPNYHEIHGAYIGNLPSSEWYDIYE